MDIDHRPWMLLNIQGIPFTHTQRERGREERRGCRQTANVNEFMPDVKNAKI